jgi:hypothetical protein
MKSKATNRTTIMRNTFLIAAAFAFATALALVALPPQPAGAKIDASASSIVPKTTTPGRVLIAQQRCHLDCHDPRQNCRLICR